MPTMQEVRAKFPQYNDMSDKQLATALHRKFYSDMPFDEFAAKVGLATPQTVADGKADRERSWGETAQDVVASGAQGFQSGLQSLLGSVGDAQQASGDVLAWGAGKLGFSPETQGVARMVGQRIPTLGLNIQAPTTEDVRSIVEPITGKYQPQTDAGRYAKGIGEFVPGAMAGPGGFVRKTAMAVMPGVATTLVGDMTDQNPYAKAGAGILAGVVAAGRGNAGTKEMLKTVGKSDEAYAKVEAATNEAYNRLRNAGIRYAAHAVDQSINDVAQLRINPQLAPDSAGLRDTFSQHLGKGMDFQDLDEMEQLATGILRDHNAKPADKFFTSAILKKIKDIRESGAIATNGSVPANEVNSLVREAKDLARSRIIARDIGKMKNKSEWYLSGPESGLRNQFKSYGQKNFQNLSKAEEAAFKSVVNREGALNIAHSVGSRMGATVMGAAGLYTGQIIPALVGMVGSAAARKIMEMYTKAGVDKAIKTVLAGRSAQEKAAVRDLLAKYEAQARLAITADTSVRQNLPQDASTGFVGVPR